MKNIGFIGGGNMAASLIGGLVADGVDARTLWVSDPQSEKLERLSQRFNVNTTLHNEELVKQADIIVFAVKPQNFGQVAMDLKDAVSQKSPLVMSIAAGISSKDIDRWLGGDNAVVRTMPNTPALVQSAATAMFANNKVDAQQRDLAESVMRAVGVTVWIDDEDLMHAVTALSGSGPAYYFLVMELMEKAAVNMGLSREIASLLTLQTAFGAAKMALESPESVETLRKFVTSPGGTTEQAVNVFQQHSIQQIFSDALTAASDRSRELAAKLGEQ